MAAPSLCCLTPETMYSALDAAGVAGAVVSADSVICDTGRARTRAGSRRGGNHRALDVAHTLHLFEQLFEIVGRVANRLVTLLRLFRQTLANDPLQFW